MDFGVDFGSTIGHGTYLFAIQFLEIGNQLFQKYYFTNICATYQITILLRCCRPMQFIQIYCLVIPRNQFTIPPNNRIAVLRWFAIWALASMDKSNFSKNLCTKKISAPKSICTKKSLHQKSLHQKISSPKTISAPKKSRHQIYCTPIWTGSPWHVEASISKLKKRHFFHSVN